MTPFLVTCGQFTRPADTTAYTAGDLVANSVTAGSVVPFEVSFTAGGNANPFLQITRVKLRKNAVSVTNAAFRVHFYADSPGTPSNGDNGAIAADTQAVRGYVDVTVDTAGSTGSYGSAAPTVPILVRPYQGKVYVLIEARGAYTPASEETFRVDFEGYRLD